MTYGQYARGGSLSFVDPYLFDYRVALGLDLFQREQLANSYIAYGTKTLGFSPRLGFTLREDLALQLRYSIYQQEIQLPNALANCNNNSSNSLLAFNPSPAFANLVGAPAGGSITDGGQTATDTSGVGLWCYSDGEASLPVRKELQSGKTLTSSVGYSLNYNTLDNNKNPTDGLLIDWKQDFAGVGGDVKYIKSAIDAKYYTPLVADIVGLIHLQGGMLNHSAAANCACSITSRWVRTWFAVLRRTASVRATSTRTAHVTRSAAPNTGALRSNCRCRSGSCRRKSGSRARSMPMPVGLFDYKGPTAWAQTGEVNCPVAPSRPRRATTGATPGTCLGLQYDDGNVVRTSVGVGIIWASPFGPLRFDYAVPLTKGQFDRVQQFKFGGGTSF